MIKHGKVVATLLIARVDGPDDDRLPDLVGATEITPKFTPLINVVSRTEPTKAIVSLDPIECVIRADGTLVDPEAADNPDIAGVKLITGWYDVDLGPRVPGFAIEVTEHHTPEHPLDLSDALNAQAPPYTTMHTIEVPLGAAQGQILIWRDGRMQWLAPGDTEIKGDPGDTGPPGTIYDSGWRDITAEVTGAAPQWHTILARRAGHTVALWAPASITMSGNLTWSLPEGFRPIFPHYSPVTNANLTSTTWTLPGYDQQFDGDRWDTLDPEPTTLPGTPWEA